MKRSLFALLLLALLLAACSPQANPFETGTGQVIQPEPTTAPAMEQSTPTTESATGVPTAIPTTLPASKGCLTGNWPDQIKQWETQICKSWTTYVTDAKIESKYGPDLIAAMIYADSNGDEKAINKFGATGLLQIMPRDAKDENGKEIEYKCINGPCFASRPSTSELSVGSFNIDYGVKMAAGMIKATDEDKMLSMWAGDIFAEYVLKILGENVPSFQR